VKRKIIATFQKTNGDPISRCNGYFLVSNYTHDALFFYSKETIHFFTDDLGRIVAKNPDNLPQNYIQPLGIDLVCTDTIDIPIKYTCVISDTGIVFEFLLPFGNTAVDLQTLQTTTITPQNPQYNTLLTYVDNILNSAINNVVAGKTQKLITDTYTATSVLSASRIINLPSFSYADCRNVGDLNSMKCLTESATTIGNNFNCCVTGTIFDSGWNFAANLPVYLGYDGFLVQTIPTDTIFVQQIGIAISTNEIFLNFKESTLL